MDTTVISVIKNYKEMFRHSLACLANLICVLVVQIQTRFNNKLMFNSLKFISILNLQTKLIRTMSMDCKKSANKREYLTIQHIKMGLTAMAVIKHSKVMFHLSLAFLANLTCA